VIGESVEKAELGTDQVKSAGDSMTHIVGQAQRVNQLISEFSQAPPSRLNAVVQRFALGRWLRPARAGPVPARQ
jgi:methyl-accepting chemotaxis protein